MHVHEDAVFQWLPPSCSAQATRSRTRSSVLAVEETETATQSLNAAFAVPNVGPAAGAA